MLNAHLPPNANGKPRTNKQFELQGWNAARHGFKVDECPYYPTSTAEKHWTRGFKSVAA